MYVSLSVAILTLNDVKELGTTNGKMTLTFAKNENVWVGLKEWSFSKLIPADFVSVVVTSFSN